VKKRARHSLPTLSMQSRARAAVTHAPVCPANWRREKRERDEFEREATSLGAEQALNRSCFHRRDLCQQRRTFSHKNPRLPDSHPNLFGLSAACYCFFSGSTLGNFLPGSNSPANAFTKAFRKALPIVVNISGRGCSNVPENGTLVPNRSFE
jgi:hypothetical protein